MEAFRVGPNDLYMHVAWNVETQTIVEMRVIGVMPGSGAEKRGIRKGDRIVAIDGLSIVSLKGSDVFSRDGMFVPHEELTFEGKRGIFGKKWSLTVKLQPQKEKEPNKAPEPTPGSVTPRAKD